MIIGILSDSHGRAQRLRFAIRVLRSLNVEALLHCGDVGGESSLDELAAASLPAWFVWGNTDFGALDPAIHQYARRIGLRPPDHAPVQVEVAGRRIAIYHGFEPEFVELLNALESGRTLPVQADYVLYGHTHQPADQRIGPVRMINPGALHRARPHTVATLDLSTDVLRYWVIDDENPAGPPIEFKLPPA